MCVLCGGGIPVLTPLVLLLSVSKLIWHLVCRVLGYSRFATAKLRGRKTLQIARLYAFVAL